MVWIKSISLDRQDFYLSQKLNDDLVKYMTRGMMLNTDEDLEHLKELVQDRKKWK